MSQSEVMGVPQIIQSSCMMTWYWNPFCDLGIPHLIVFRTSFGWENTHTPIQRQWSDGESCPLHTLFTPHSTLQTLDSPVPLQSTLHPEAVYTPYSTLYFTTPHSKVCTLHFTLYTLHFKLSTPHSTQKTLFSTLHSPKSTMVGDRERIYNTLVTNCLPKCLSDVHSGSK